MCFFSLFYDANYRSSKLPNLFVSQNKIKSKEEKAEMKTKSIKYGIH